MEKARKNWLVLGLIALALAGGYYAWQNLDRNALPAGIASGNGRIEAVEIDISTKTPGRIREIMVDEGDFVTAGQVLAQMDTVQLEAHKRQAEAQQQRAIVGVEAAKNLVTQREAEKAAAEGVLAQRRAQLDAAERRLARSEQLVKTSTVSQQVLDDDRATAEGARAAASAAEASLAASDAAINSAKSQVIDAQASVEAAKASVESIVADINDSTLVSPRDGRIQYRVVQPGEVLAAGGRVLNLVDLGDVYMTFFLPTDQAGLLSIGSEVRLVLDAAPQYIIPAKVSYVADVAQFTPKTVETAEERQKLTFRIKAQIPKELLKKYIRMVKTGLPGVAYVKVDPKAEWPASQTGTLVQ
ncbi:Multidrug resistance protein MdtN [Ensifer adhaerens]|uniref:HlyD family secretion protein n=1 Tax=Ensifer adhaerens TaxID=106592 RepID=UPI00156A645B|nr:HlyD family efflux transporter periplasmic adaptor subunit [Ensifer adhaerens]NRP20654.1 Multidrug resistance protein MdtN [Ensifer adhaerens]